jgi:cleavage and polyadenylation specificity factor subunit 1
MQAIHQPLIPETGIRHSLFLEHFTPSTIYPYPQPAWVRRYGLSSSDDPDGPRIKITGNLIVAGGSELRVFEVREEPVLLGEQNGQDAGEQLGGQNERIQDDQQMDADMGDDEGFRNMATSGVTEVRRVVPRRW